MITGISKKLIFFSFLFINFLQPSKSAESVKINKNINNQNINSIWSKLFKEENLSSFSKIPDDNTSYLNFSKKKHDSLLVANGEKKQELMIQSDKQSEINDVIYAEGNV